MLQPIRATKFKSNNNWHNYSAFTASLWLLISYLDLLPDP